MSQSQSQRLRHSAAFQGCNHNISTFRHEAAMKPHSVHSPTYLPCQCQQPQPPVECCRLPSRTSRTSRRRPRHDRRRSPHHVQENRPAAVAGHHLTTRQHTAGRRRPARTLVQDTPRLRPALSAQGARHSGSVQQHPEASKRKERSVPRAQDAGLCAALHPAATEQMA